MQEQVKFWAIIELFGHTTLAGEVSPAPIGELIQINVPETTSSASWTKMVNPKAVYAINPTDEATARARAEALGAMPVDKWSVGETVARKIDQLVSEGKLTRVLSESARVNDYVVQDDGEVEW